MKWVNALMKLLILALLSFCASATPTEAINDFGGSSFGEDTGYGEDFANGPIRDEEINGTPDSAFAAAGSKCTVGKWSKTVLTYASLDASNEVRRTKLLAVAPNPKTGAWGLHSKAYIWDDNDDVRQKWWLECRGFQEHDQLNMYYLRYAYDTNLCLTPTRTYPPGINLTLEACGKRFAGQQLWEVEYNGWRWSYAQRDFVRTYIIRHVHTPTCIDVRNANNANGTPVILWDCNGRDNQLWY